MAQSWSGSWGRKYVRVSDRLAQGKRAVEVMRDAGQAPEPVEVEGRGRLIAKTFWGKAWCDHLEKFSDLASRLPRGRTYVKNGSVLDLKLTTGLARALVAGSSVYTVRIEVDKVEPQVWEGIKAECGGEIGSLVELLQGKVSSAVMGIMTRKEGGLLPTSTEIRFHCNCPDYARMCKHVAAVLYGMGVRLDTRPELLFQLRGVDPTELLIVRPALAGDAVANELPAEDLEAVFGISLGEPGDETAAHAEPELKPRKRGRPKSK